ncbi:MAG: YbaK/EbsC family protein [Patescibacteria group bacterium]|nr:YbaK/EbsC family protein [Patescibacteria group bacterium]
MLKRLENFLKKSKAVYKLMPHKTVYTTFDLAQTLRADLKEIAKTLLVRADTEFIFAVVPGNRRLDIMRLKKLINAERKKMGERACQKLKIASEAQIKMKITKKAGTLVPFGSLYKQKTYIDKLLLKNKKIILNAGSFEEAIKITASVYRKIEKPVEGLFSKAR